MEWNDLQYFLAVCERGSVGGAARALGVNHSTVLRRLSSLERTLAVRLFDRLPRGYALTEQGQELAANVAGVTEQIEAAQRRVTGGDKSLSGTIRLTAPDPLIAPLLLPLLAEFLRLHAQLRIQLVAGNSFLNLTQREADVAVRGSNSPPDNLIGRRVGRIQTALYGARHYLRTLPAGHSNADYRWVGHAPSLSHLDSAQWMQRHVAEERVALRVDSLASLCDAVAAGIGVGWLLCALAGERRELEQLQPPLPAFDTQVWVLSHPDLKRVARIKALTDFLHERLSADTRLVR
jgi:DNA-binding transcriptional LysR family regulator